ncbi:MAG: MBL fold metallo-hydrolase [Desulfurococcales archaeon]|nr:MBL fold metallo-hydrolase [Desulfurococcales archaeon]
MARVILLVGDKRGRFPGSNCLLVKGAKKALLVDAGCREEQVLEARDRVDAVLYTHIHPDHIPRHSLLRGKPMIAPLPDSIYHDLEGLARRYAPEIWRDWINYVHTVFSLRELPTIDRAYGAWEEVRVGDISIQTVPAPGHTLGHTLLLIDKHLHLSDIDLTSFGPWYGHPESSVEQFISDIMAAASIEAGQATTSHREKIFARKELEDEISRYMGALCRQAQTIYAGLIKYGPSTPEGLAGKGLIYRRYLPSMEAVMNYFEKMMIWKLLDHLATRGLVKRTASGFYEAVSEEAPACGSII